MSREKRRLARETPATRTAKARVGSIVLEKEKKRKVRNGFTHEVILHVYILNPSEETAHGIAV